MLTGLPIGLPFLRSDSGASSWTPSSATGATLLQWLHDIDTDGSPWLKDKSQTGDDRILGGGPGLQQGQCIELNGTNQSGDVAHDDALDYSEGETLTLEGHAYASDFSTGSRQGFIYKDRQYFARCNATGYLELAIPSVGSASAATTAFVDGSWNAWKIVYDTTADQVTYTVNGTTNTVSFSASPNASTNAALDFGDAAGGDLFGGKLFGIKLTIDSTLKAWWRMDEQSGSTFYDCAGSAHHGTWVNSPTYATQDVYSWHNTVGYRLNGSVFVPRDESDTANDVTGTALTYSGAAPRHARLRDNYCVTLNGTNQYVIPSGFTPTTTGEMQIKFKYAGSGGMLVGCNNASAHRCYFGINGGKLAAGIGSDSWAVHVGATSLSSGQWYEGKVTWDGTDVKIYYKQLDTGTESSWTLDYTGTENGSIPTSTAMGIGCNSNNGTPGNYFNGDICDVRLNATHRFPLSSKGAGGGPNGIWNVVSTGLGYSWLNSPALGTQDVFAWNTTVGFHNASGTIHEGLADGSTDTQGNTMSNPAVDGHNGSEAHIDFNPYTIPSLASGNTDSYAVPTDWDVFEDDLKTPDQHWCLREDQDNDHSEFVLYDDELTGDDWDNAHAYVQTVSQLNTLLEHYWSMDALTGSAPQTTVDEINSLTLSGGTMDAETTVTPAKRGNAIEIIDTGGSADATLSASAPSGLNLNKPVSFFGWVKLSVNPATADCMLIDQNAGSFRLVATLTDHYLKWTYNSQVITDTVDMGDGNFHFVVAARDANGNLTLWRDGSWIGKQAGVTMPDATGTLQFGADGDMGGDEYGDQTTVHYDELGATDTNKLRDNHVGFLSAGKYLNKTSNEFEA